MKDLKGQRFGKLVASEIVGSKKHSGYLWKCKCDCGNTHLVYSSKLISGRTKSCGCLRREIAAERKIKHGLTHHNNKGRLYKIWCGMRERCYYTKSISYPSYGGRGIKVCDDWNNNYAKFYEWAMTHGYKDTLTIDRIDNEKGYTPENCQWVDAHYNKIKQRKAIILYYNGELLSLTNIARHKLHTNPNSLRNIYNQKGIEGIQDFALKKHDILPLIEQPDNTTPTNK